MKEDQITLMMLLLTIGGERFPNWTKNVYNNYKHNLSGRVIVRTMHPWTKNSSYLMHPKTNLF